MAIVETALFHQMSPLWLMSLLMVTFWGLKEVSAQGKDFSKPIKCYTCEGSAKESLCADPLDVDNSNITYKVCDQGICLKWTKYKNYELMMVRTCSDDLNFELTMIDGVCRTERNGNGYLCMCGKNLCNSAPPSVHPSTGTLLLLPSLAMAAILTSQASGIQFPFETLWSPRSIS